jgi:hypothetical protein
VHTLLHTYFDLDTGAYFETETGRCSGAHDELAKLEDIMYKYIIIMLFISEINIGT